MISELQSKLEIAEKNGGVKINDVVDNTNHSNHNNTKTIDNDSIDTNDPNNLNTSTNTTPIPLSSSYLVNRIQQLQMKIDRGLI